MEARNYFPTANIVPYTPAADVAAGTVVVQGDLVGVALRPLAANQQGELLVFGTVEAKKGTGAIAVGTVLYWDDTNNIVTTTATGNKRIGISAAPAAASDSYVMVLLGR